MFSGFPQPLKEIFGIVPLIRPQLIPSLFSLIHYSTIALPLDAMQSKLLAEFLNKLLINTD
jgi:hypothetical protein